MIEVKYKFNKKKRCWDVFVTASLSNEQIARMAQEIVDAKVRDEEKFQSWLSQMTAADREKIDAQTFRNIYDAMDEKDK